MEEEDEEEDVFVAISPDLVDGSSLCRGAIPVLPVGAAILCCVCNILLPGSGTVMSGVLSFMFCCGPGPRFSQPPSDPDSCNFENRLFCLLVNVAVGVLQLGTVLLCLVGWCWSIGWGIAIVTIAGRNEVFLKEQEYQRAEKRKSKKSLRRELMDTEDDDSRGDQHHQVAGSHGDTVGNGTRRSSQSIEVLSA